MADFDLAVIGGGITGTGIARNAAGRGLRVLLVEPHDLSAGTSSAPAVAVSTALSSGVAFTVALAA
jgi:glycerol-3-phosphate dehydrogenase